MKRIQRKVEEAVGGRLIEMVSNGALKKSKLIPKSVDLPTMGLTMNYLERPSSADQKDPPTILLCHGLSDQAKNLAAFITSLQVPKEVRILVPDAIGHGQDLLRAKQEGEKFQQPTSTSILESTSELLQVLQVEKCNAFGYSMGGALVYFLRYKYPHLVQKSVLVSPSLESCLDSQFIDDFVQGRKNHWCLESRDDAKRLFRDLSVPHRTKKDPIPKFLLEALWRRQVAQAPPRHYRTMLERLLKELGDHSEFNTTQDLDPNSPRLVFWPEYDFICNHDKGKTFFEQSGPNTTFETLFNCGHMFHSNGTFILDMIPARVAQYLLDFESPES
mmetsp:Transcript_21877/g.41384  ORF Transcript_21877/g.41384 Transcript_21877/m.41384 type:complete len:331 (+) Transcript_21877:97-1089(+)